MSGTVEKLTNMVRTGTDVVLYSGKDDESCDSET